MARGAVEHCAGPLPRRFRRLLPGSGIIGLVVLAHDATVSWPLIAGSSAILQAGARLNDREPRLRRWTADHHPARRGADRHRPSIAYRYLSELLEYTFCAKIATRCAALCRSPAVALCASGLRTVPTRFSARYPHRAKTGRLRLLITQHDRRQRGWFCRHTRSCDENPADSASGTAFPASHKKPCL